MKKKLESESKVLQYFSNTRQFGSLRCFFVKVTNNTEFASLVGFYGISSILGYLMPNPLYTYILNT